MNTDREGLARSIIAVCRLLHERDWLAACDGNISVRHADGSILITPTARHKGFIAESDLALLDPAGNPLSGIPSSEKWMHLAVYRQCPDARAVVHAHPPVAIAWSVAKPNLKELPSESLSEVILAVGSIPIVPYARPGGQDLAATLKPFLPDHRVMIMARHGAVAWGESLEEAYLGIERLEHSARTLMYAKLLGGTTRLPPREVDILKRMRGASRRTL